jgi:hypothetical protein
MAAHDLAAYFEDELPGHKEEHERRHCRPHRVAIAWSHMHGRHC